LFDQVFSFYRGIPFFSWFSPVLSNDAGRLNTSVEMTARLFYMLSSTKEKKREQSFKLGEKKNKPTTMTANDATRELPVDSHKSCRDMVRHSDLNLTRP
jgi:hypothetical protein